MKETNHVQGSSWGGKMKIEIMFHISIVTLMSRGKQFLLFEIEKWNPAGV
jgi:hypothetical protein